MLVRRQDALVGAGTEHAGQTAKDFATACKPVEGGYDAVIPDGARIHYDAASGAEVQSALRSVAAMVCCGCIGRGRRRGPRRCHAPVTARPGFLSVGVSGTNE